MGQDSWNLQYGRQIPAKTRRGGAVNMHSDEGYGGPKVIPGYAGAYKNSKTKVLKSNANPVTFGPERDKKSVKYGNESGVMRPTGSNKRRK